MCVRLRTLQTAMSQHATVVHTHDHFANLLLGRAISGIETVEILMQHVVYT